MAKLSPQGIFRAFDELGAPLAGGKVYTYVAGTSTNKDTFTTETGDVANANPVILDSEGYAQIWLESGSYKFVVDSSTDVNQYTTDNIVGDSTGGYASAVFTLSANTVINSTYQNSLLICDTSITLSLIAAATAGEGFVFTVKNTSTGDVTIDPDASELIDGVSTLAVIAGETMNIVSNGIGWDSFNTPKSESYSADTGAANAYAVSIAPTPTSYTAGLEVTFKATNANTGASTINVNGLGVKSIKKDVSIALAADDIIASKVVSLVYDGTNFQLINVPASSGAWELISTTDFDGTTDEVDISSVMAGYVALRVTFVNITAAGNSTIYARASNNGGSTFLSAANDYSRALTQQATNSTTISAASDETRDYLDLSASNTANVGGSMQTSAIITGFATGFGLSVFYNTSIVDDSTPFGLTSSGSLFVNDKVIVDGFKFYNPFAVDWATGGKFILEGISA